MGFKKYKCYGCGHTWMADCGIIEPSFCPLCKDTNFKKVLKHTNTEYRFLVPWDITANSISHSKENNNSKVK